MRIRSHVSRAAFPACALVLLLVPGITACGSSAAQPSARAVNGGATSASRLPPVPPDDVMLSPAGAKLALRRSALADQWFWLRTKVIEGDVPPGFERARAAMQELRGALGNDSGAWEDVEVLLGSARSAEELTALCGDLPEARATDEGRMTLRAPAVQAARELHATEALFRAGPYRGHAEAIDGAARELAKSFAARESALTEAMRADMGITDPLPPIVLTLVADAPYAAAFAADDRGRAAAVFLRVRGLAGTALLETALAESLHAIDELTVRTPTTAMNVLRAALAKTGMGESDSNLEMIVNTVTFAEAASLVRRFADPKHRALGESGFYELYPPAKRIVAAWERHLAGEPLEATAAAIARAVAEP